jgi:hypothetical protein
MDREVFVRKNGHRWEVSIDPKKTLEEIVLDLDSRSDTRPIKAVTLVVTRRTVFINAHTEPPFQP